MLLQKAILISYLFAADFKKRKPNVIFAHLSQIVSQNALNTRLQISCLVGICSAAAYEPGVNLPAGVNNRRRDGVRGSGYLYRRYKMAVW